MRHHRWDTPLLLPGFLLLDVSWGGPAVPHARRGLWERILTEKVLLRVWLPLPCHCGRRLHSYRLQELRDGESVSAAFWTNPWKCRADTLDATLCGLTRCVCMRQLFEKKLHLPFLPGPCVPLWIPHQKHLSSGWTAVQFFMSFESGWRTQHCGFRGAAATLKPFCLKTLLWPLVCKCSLKEKSAVQKKPFT